jgi:outer membrane protein
VIPARPADLAPSPLPLSEVEIMQLAEASSPTVVASAYVTRAAAASVRSAKTGYLPSLSLSSGYNWNHQERSFNGGRTSWSLGMSLSYPIFNNFQRESSTGRAQFSQRVAQLQEDDSRLAARQEADAALYNLRTAGAGHRDCSGG